jgi:hypothetical protein
MIKEDIQWRFDHSIIDKHASENIFNLEIKRDYLALFCEQNLANSNLNNPTR